MSVPNQSSVVTGLSHAQMQATYLAQRRPPENKQVPQAPLPSNVHLRRNEQGNSSSSSASSRIQMPPPIHLPNRQGSVSTHRSLASVNQTFSEQPLGIANPTPIQSNRFQPPSTSDSQHLKSAPHDRRFVPSAPVHRHMTPSGAGLGGSRAPSRSTNRTTSNHRIPFTPNAKLAFER